MSQISALWGEERGCVSEQVSSMVLGIQGEAWGDDEMQSAAVLDAYAGTKI